MLNLQLMYVYSLHALPFGGKKEASPAGRCHTGEKRTGRKVSIGEQAGNFTASERRKRRRERALLARVIQQAKEIHKLKSQHVVHVCVCMCAHPHVL